MCLITYHDIDKKSILKTDENNSMTIFGSMIDLDEHLKPKIMKTVNVFKNSLTTKNKCHKDIVNNLKVLMTYDIASKPPQYNHINNCELKNDMNQTLINTLQLSKKAKEYSVKKILYNACNHIFNPPCTRFENKHFSIELKLIKDFNSPETTNHSLISKSSVDTVFSKRVHANSISSYTKRKSSVVTSVIEELNNMKELQQTDDLAISLKLKKSNSQQKSENLFTDRYFNTNIFNSNQSSRPSLNLQDTRKSQSPTDFNIMDFAYSQTLNEEYDTALNKDPRVVLFPTVTCKNPSSNTHTLDSVRRLSQLAADDNANFVEDESDRDDESNQSSSGLLRVQSRYSDTSNNEVREDDVSDRIAKTILKSKVSMLKGSIQLNNKSDTQALLLSNLKIKLCGYKLIYGHLVLIEEINEKSTRFDNLSAATESVNGLRVTKPFITKELDLLQNTNGSLVVRNNKEICFEFLIDSTEFPSTLNCQYGKIEYRLEVYSNLVNIGNVILNDLIVIHKTLEPEVCNLIDQNDSVYKLNNALNVNNKRSTNNGQTYNLRYTDLEKSGFDISNLIEEDDYLKKDWLNKYIKEHCKDPKEINYLKDELRQPKIFYDVFLSSKTIILNEPFQLFFSIKKALNCNNDWFITECSLTLEQHYCFPVTKKIINKDYENAKIEKKKYKKIFFHNVQHLKPKLSEKRESIYVEDAVIHSDLSFYEEIFNEHKEYIRKNSADSIMPHYDELNTLKPEVNDEIQNMISVSHKLRIGISMESDRSEVEEKGVKLKKQFSMSIPVYVITSSMHSTMILPEYIK